MSKDLNNDSKIDVTDILYFDSLYNHDALSYTLKYNDTYQSLLTKIRDNDMEYINELFHAYTINSFVANDILVSDSIVFTIDIEENGELRIYDFKTKEIIGKLKLINNTLSNPTSVDIPQLYLDKSNNRMYVNNLFDTTYIVDITTLSEPNLLGRYYDGGNKLLGNIGKVLFYKNNGYSSLEENIIDVSNPTEPFPVGNLENLHQVVDNKAYLLDYGESISLYEPKKIKVIDITSPTNIQPLYEYDSTFTSFINNYFVKNNYLYIIKGNTMRILYLDNLGNATLVGEYSDKYNDLRGNIADVKKNIVYIESSTSPHLILINIQNIKEPYLEQVIINPASYVNRFKVIDNYIMHGNKIIDLLIFSLQSHIVLQNNIRIWGRFECTIDNTLYLADNSGGRGIYEINIENPFNVYTQNSYSLEQNSYSNDLVLSGTQNLVSITNKNLYFMKDYNTLNIYDIYNLNAPTHSITLEIEHQSINSLWVSGDMFYISYSKYSDTLYQGTELQKYDLSDLNNPKLLGTLSLSQRINNIAFQANKLYIANGSGGLHLVDWSQNNPSILDTYRINEIIFSSAPSISKVILKNNIAYILASGKYIEVLDITDSKINLISRYKLDNYGEFIGDIFIENELLYFTTQFGLYTLNILDFDNLKVLKKYKYTIDSSTDLTLIKKENLMYIIDSWNHGLYILDLKLFNRSDL